MQLPAFVIAYSDSSFTNPHETARPDEPPECTGNFTHMGAKYWGFETARHRATRVLDSNDGFRFDHNAHHWIHLGLKQSSRVNRITISTKWFTGNHVPEASVELIRDGNVQEVLTRVTLAPDQDHSFDIEPTEADECLVKCFHEGGIARINLHGEPLDQDSDPENLLKHATISHVSNEHYGKPHDAVIGERQVDYMLGWESARSGFGEYALFHLRAPTRVSEVIVDTYLHRLNPPLSCHIFGITLQNESELEGMWQARPSWAIEFDDGSQVIPDDFRSYMQDKRYLDEPASNTTSFNVRLLNRDERWLPIVSFGRLHEDRWHRFSDIETSEPITHLLYTHYPNGGIHGLKVYGEES